MFKITVMTKQYPTEDQKKIRQALGTVLAGEINTKNYGKEVYLYKESKKHKDLERFYELVRQQRILDVARKTLRKGIRIEIEYKDIEQLIDWLTPYTKNGAEVKLVKSFP
ncbi:MAG: hypothetical protein ACTSP5_11990 [Candidatus Heimdallarchaeota archaeon]